MTPAHAKREQLDGAGFNSALQFLGIRSAYESLGGMAKAYIKEYACCEKPKIVFGSSLADVAKDENALKIKGYLKRIALDGYMEFSNKKIPGYVAATVLPNLYEIAKFLVAYRKPSKIIKARKFEEELAFFATKIIEAFEPIKTEIVTGYDNYFNTIELSLLYKSVACEYFYYVIIDVTTTKIKITLNKKNIEKTSFFFNGTKRNAYPIEFAFCNKIYYGKVSKDDWKDEPKVDENWKIFIQDHAVRRMNERLKIGNAILPYYVGWLETFIYPKKIRGKKLIPYYLFHSRLGYFAYEILEKEKVILLTTFLTPMMSGTPESDALYEKLKLTNEDTRYLGLDNIESLLTSDLLKDPHTKEIFKDCGMESPDFLHSFIIFNVPKLELAERFKKHICFERPV